MKLVKPINEEKREQLEREFEAQKRHLSATFKEAIDAVQAMMKPSRWFSAQPVESLFTLFFMGYAVGRKINKTYGQPKGSEPLSAADVSTSPPAAAGEEIDIPDVERYREPA